MYICISGTVCIVMLLLFPAAEWKWAASNSPFGNPWNSYWPCSHERIWHSFRCQEWDWFCPDTLGIDSLPQAIKKSMIRTLKPLNISRMLFFFSKLPHFLKRRNHFFFLSTLLAEYLSTIDLVEVPGSATGNRTCVCTHTYLTWQFKWRSLDIFSWEASCQRMVWGPLVWGPLVWDLIMGCPK